MACSFFYCPALGGLFPSHSQHTCGLLNHPPTNGLHRAGEQLQRLGLHPIHIRLDFIQLPVKVGHELVQIANQGAVNQGQQSGRTMTL